MRRHFFIAYLAGLLLGVTVGAARLAHADRAGWGLARGPASVAGVN